MHNNYYFIKQLTKELQNLKGYKLIECFSQQKEELIFIFENSKDEYFIIQAHLGSDFSSLFFPENFNRAKKNTRNIFPDLLGLTLTDIIQINNDRSFLMTFENEKVLLFKLYGNRGNIIYFNDGELVKLFKPKLKNDYNLRLEELNRPIDFSFEAFNQKGLKKTFFTFGPVVEKVLNERGFPNLDKQGQYLLIQQVLKELETPDFYISNIGSKVVLSLLETGDIISKHSKAIDAANSFYRAYYKYNYFDKQKAEISRIINQKVSKSGEYVEKCKTRLAEIESGEAPERVADVIMANLHAIPEGAEKVTLYNFYTDSNIEVKLKKKLTPQKVAEGLYKKGKKRPLEVKNLEELVENKENRALEMLNDLEKVQEAEDYKDLKPFVQKYLSEKGQEKEEVKERFKNFDFMGFKIYVGRNASNNDELTLHFAHKDDLWLHARDVPGSHVIIKHQSGKNFPVPVIEKAASVAAYFSGRKTETLCPVIYTEKKFVRKVKGAPKGAVRVDKENVVMVVPEPFPHS